MEFFTISMLNGLSYGLLLFMLSSGLTLIFSMMGVLNFAHASAYMLGAYFAYTLSLFVGFWWALLFAPILCGLFGAGIEMYGLRRVHKNGHVAELLFTFGLALIIGWCVLAGMSVWVAMLQFFVFIFIIAIVTIPVGLAAACAFEGGKFHQGILHRQPAGEHIDKHQVLNETLRLDG